MDSRMMSITGFQWSKDPAGARKESVRVFFHVMAARMSTMPVTSASR